MSRAHWIALSVITVPVLIGATVVSATLGPIGAIAYAGVLFAGVNARHLFPHDHEDD